MKSKRIIKSVLLDGFFVMICLSTVLPFLLMLSISLSNETDVVINGYKLIPEHIEFTAYEYLFRNPATILNAYKFTIFQSVVGTVFSVFMMTLMAYPLSLKNFKLKRFFSLYMFITMIFSGGMAASYIINTQVFGLFNSVWVFILPGSVSAWYVFLIRTFFQGIPSEMGEAAKIDGAGHLRIYFTMMLPLSKPVLATVTLMVLLAKWNNWTTSMLYVTDEKMNTVQFLLQRILENLNMIKDMQEMGINLGNMSVPSETVRMGMAVLAAGPMIMVFPFFQKYFTKGMTVGSVKG